MLRHEVGDVSCQCPSKRCLNRNRFSRATSSDFLLNDSFQDIRSQEKPHFHSRAVSDGQGRDMRPLLSLLPVNEWDVNIQIFHSVGLVYLYGEIPVDGLQSQ